MNNTRNTLSRTKRNTYTQQEKDTIVEIANNFKGKQLVNKLCEILGKSILLRTIPKMIKYPLKKQEQRGKKSKFAEFFEIFSANHKEFDYAQILLSESEICSIRCELLKKSTENTSDSESVETWEVVIIAMKTAQMIQ